MELLTSLKVEFVINKLISKFRLNSSFNDIKPATFKYTVAEQYQCSLLKIKLVHIYLLMSQIFFVN